MSLHAKNKWLTGLVILLLAANAVTITLFWMGRTRTGPLPQLPPPNTDYLVKELKLDTAQQRQLQELVQAHRAASEKMRLEIKNGKDSLFEGVKRPAASDSTSRLIAARVSQKISELDLLTLDHFRQIRAICRPDQQKRFDEVIEEVIRRMAPSRPQPPGGQGGPPPPDGAHNPPPPGNGHEPPPPPGP